MFHRLREDIANIMTRDPAARSAWEVLTCYPGLHAIAHASLAHWCWWQRLKWLGRFISTSARMV
jgi:serine O-acetyltransferase